jgi:uncharacterized protein YjbJ (UPF0337 family)
MKALPFILAGISVGVVACIVLNQPVPQYAEGDDDLEYAAYRTSLWGGKQRITGTGGNLAGKVKEGFGRATGDDDLAAEGVSDQVLGAVKNTAGRVAQAAGDTLHELNR